MQIQIPVENILEDRIYVAKEYDSDISSIPDLEALELLAVVKKENEIYVSFFDSSALSELLKGAGVGFWVFLYREKVCYSIESKKEYIEIASLIQNELSRRMGYAEEMKVTA